MKKIMLKIPVTIEVVDGDNTEKVKVNLRALTKKESREAKARFDTFQKLSTQIDRLSIKMESAMKKAGYSEQLGKVSDAMEYQKKADAITEDLDGVFNQIENLGGEDFHEKTAENNFLLMVSGGKGVARLKELAGTYGYLHIMRLLGKAREEAEGKR